MQKKLLAFILTIATLSGCAIIPPVSDDISNDLYDAKICQERNKVIFDANQGLSYKLNKFLDGHFYCIPYITAGRAVVKDSQNNEYRLIQVEDVAKSNDVIKIDNTPMSPELSRRLLLLRAHVVLAMLARWGQARIPDYEGSNQAQAAQALITRIRLTEESFRDSLRSAREVDYPLHRAELVFNQLSAAVQSAKSSAKGVKNFFGSLVLAVGGGGLGSTLDDGAELGKNVLRDQEFIVAYREVFANMARRIVVAPGSFGQQWLVSLKDLEGSCGTLQKIASIGSAFKDVCLPQDVKDNILESVQAASSKTTL
ncbi:MAG: hypothetical protein HQL96_09730 [Magnetococcales bacterium]|nr:hypothetical protein [Magnetococcales bacterium]